MVCLNVEHSFMHRKLYMLFLIALELSHNQLTSLPDNFDELLKCTSLKLSDNKFTEFPDVLFSMPLMETLDLSHNELTSLDTTRLSQTPSLQRVTLTGNPLNEDCKAILDSMARLKTIL